METELVHYLNENFSLELKEEDYGRLKEILAVKVNQLITNDFTQLIRLLYKIDVNELKLKRFLKENSAIDAADIIATLIIERQLQKIHSRKQFREDNNFNSEEKW